MDFQMGMQFFDLNGNEVSEDEWADALTRGLVHQVIDEYQQRAKNNVAGMVCPKHGGTASLSFTVSGDPESAQIDIKAEACCDEFAQAAIREAYRSWPTS
jgi:hypothetical protein